MESLYTSPTALASDLAGQSRHFQRAAALPPRRDPRNDTDRLIEVLGVNQEETAEMFARFRERAVGGS